ncbi:MAG: DsrE family protein [Gammaproteobacteria bacterium]|nr:DsrE family protein [Gammaproteobacteria bacterium]
MKKIIFVMLVLGLSAWVADAAETPQSSSPPDAHPSKGPVIEDFGPYLPVADPDFGIPAGQTLNVVFDLAKALDTGQLNPHLETPARFLNMHAGAGLGPERMHLAVVVHGQATRDLLTDEAYQKRFGAANPNRALLQALAGAGVEIILCGQSAGFGGYTRSEFLPQVEMALSAMTALVVLQERGYRLIAF